MQTLVFSALSDNSRMAIVDFLRRRKSATCCEIADEIEKDASTVFRHLEILERAGIISAEKRGRELVCSLRKQKELEALMRIAKKI